MRAQSKGFKYTSVQGRAFQLGGCWLSDNGKILYEHIEKFPGDLADISEILVSIPLRLKSE
jgi:hypothetical protein